MLLAAERGMVAADIAAVVRMHEEPVRRWLMRCQAEGLEGLTDAPRPGAPAKATRSYRERLLALVRRRPRALGLPFSLWTGDRLSDYLAEKTGVRMSRASVYRLLRAGAVHLNRPQHTITSPDRVTAGPAGHDPDAHAADTPLWVRRGQPAHGRDSGAGAPAEATT